MKDRILLFIPAYNCEAQIVRVLAQLDDEIMPYIEHVIVVNNRSTDRTEEAIMQFIQKHPLPLSILRNHENYNLGGSHKVAFEFALANRFDYVIVLHGDDQGDVHDILPLLESGDYKNYACCLGSRFMRGSKRNGYSALRTIANYGFNLWFSIVCGMKITDLGSGLNIYKTEALKSRYYIKFPDKLFFNDIMLLAAKFYKLNVLFFPISWREEDQVSNAKLFDFGCMLLKATSSFIFSKKHYIKSEMRDKSFNSYTYDDISTL